MTGGAVLGWLDVGIGSEAVRALAEAALTLVLFADASRIDLVKLCRESRCQGRAGRIGLPPDDRGGHRRRGRRDRCVSWPEALVLAIVIAPTDAALGRQAAVSGRRLPIRHPPGPERRRAA